MYSLPDTSMLLSFVNMKLRDRYQNPDAMCEDLDADRKEIDEKLAGIGYAYDPGRNQYV